MAVTARYPAQLVIQVPQSWKDEVEAEADRRNVSQGEVAREWMRMGRETRDGSQEQTEGQAAQAGTEPGPGLQP